MVEAEDFLMRPVMRDMIKGDKLLDASSGVDLAFIALLNEAIDVEIENTRRARVAEANAAPPQRRR
jgi:hypothetical protein